MEDVNKHRHVLDKIHTAYRKKRKHNAYEQITFELQKRWAPPAIMAQWCKIWLDSVCNSKEKFRTDKYYNLVACQALIWFIRVNDKDAVKKLPRLTAFPLFEEAKIQFLSLTPKGFAEWAKVNITTAVFRYRHFGEYYCKLLMSTGVVADNYTISLDSSQKYYYLYNEPGGDRETIAISNIAYYSDKVGHVSEKDKKILLDYYIKWIKGKRMNSVVRKREECILHVLKKYKILPQSKQSKNNTNTISKHDK